MTDPGYLAHLQSIVESRKGASPETSYIAKLFAKGRNKLAQKVGEEAVEVAIAAVAEERKELVGESADLLYHLAVLWAECEVSPAEVWAKLAEREGTSGLIEKASRNPVAPGDYRGD